MRQCTHSKVWGKVLHAAATQVQHTYSTSDILKQAKLQALATQVDIHAPWGGVVPNLAMEAHAAAMDGTVAAALARAGVQPCDLDAVAVTVGPGLALCLQVRRLSLALADGLARTQVMQLWNVVACPCPQDMASSHLGDSAWCYNSH